VVVAVVQLQGAYVKSLETTAIVAADSYAKALDGMRALYTSEVVNRLPEGVAATHDYELRAHEVPLPMTLTLLLADHLDESVEGLEVRLYSEYPFPWSGPAVMDDFERRAFEVLRDQPDSTYTEFEETEAGRTLRFARGDPMRAQCVSCHNSHADSPKTDWQVGELRGVLAISFPLGSFQEDARATRRPYEMLLLLALLGLLASLVMLVPVESRPAARAVGRKDGG
jgi:adenylate cyclase